MTLVDSATRKVIAKETVAVQMIWGDVDAATAGTKPAPQQPANVRPGPAPKQPTNQGKMMRLQLQGYEVSQDTVGALFMAQSKELNPKAMLSAVSALVASGKATLVKMPSVQAASGARAKSEDDSDYTLELEMVRGADKSYVSANYYLRQKSGPGTIANGFLTRMGEVTVLGNVAGSSAEKLVLVFGRVTDE